MKLVLDGNKCKIFMEIFHHLKGVSTVLNLTFSKEGLLLRGMDTACVSLFDMRLSNNWFDEYSVEDNDIKEIGVNIGVLHKILSTKQDTQKLQIGYTGSTPDKLNILFISEDKSTFNNWFAMPLIDLEIDTVEIPEKEHQVDIQLPANKFGLIIDQLLIFNDSFKMNCLEDKVICMVDGDEGEMRINMDMESMTEYGIEEDTELIAGYSTRLVHKVCAFKNIASQVYIGISENYPLEIKYNIDGTSYIRFMVAPKIEED